jgi:uncharacterized protein (TIGR00369 family)
VVEANTQTFSFAQLGEDTLSDEQFVAAYNGTMPPGMRLMNAKMLSAAANRGEVVLSYELDDRFVNVAGFISGGYIAQALDQAATAAATLVSSKAAPTVEFKTSFLRAARSGLLVVTGAVVQVGKSIAFTEAKAVDSKERLLATATVTSQLISAAVLVEKNKTGGESEGSDKKGIQVLS